MMIALMTLYLALLFTLVWLGIIRFNTFWKMSPLIVLLLLTIGLFIPMGWGAPQGAALVAFIDTSDTLIGVEIDQIDARYITPGQEVEVTFKFVPGHVYAGKVDSILQAIASGQAQTSGTAVAPKAIEAAPFVVRVRLDDAAFAKALPAGATGTAAIYTEHLKPTHAVRRVILRQLAILNYINPF